MQVGVQKETNSIKKEGKKFKVRLVAKRYSQQKGIDYDDIFPSVVRHTSIRAVLALVASWDLHLEQIDVNTMFLHGDLEEQIYMEQPDGFTQPGHDHLNLDGGSSIFLLLYVDDMLIVAKSMYDVLALKALLSQEFDMKDLGAATKILGMEIHRDRGSRKRWLSQRGFVEKVLDNAVGYLMYAMVCTRPDLAHAVSQVCKYMSKPVQSIVALSTIETEYMAVAEAAKEALWLSGLSKELGVEQCGVKLHCDSQSVLYLSKNQVYHARTKHIDMRYHKIRELIASGEIILQKVHTSENAADMLTKPLTVDKFNHCLDLLNVYSC
ncbi:UNVERIFIED_CONTAM: Retrovirus-related Pol polyprotein from transposon TNT 1-94 [Sesamum angustifolium]|uniref:Retrovirus-related Pol polyprotein from transposon TNT 1-94 n=1 Tax=Sesamum angustifolium TaxID=2727405 RepID=A0AAW2LZU5_9LAMI